MSVFAPNTLLSRLLAWAIVACCTGTALYWAGGKQVLRYLDGVSKLERLADQSRRYQTLAAQRAVIEGTLSELEQQAPLWTAHYLGASDANLAAAELQQLLTRTLRAQGVTVDRMDVRPQQGVETPIGTGVVAAQIQLTADYSLFLAALRDLEGMTPLLALDEVSLQPVLTRGTLRRPDARKVAVRLSIRAMHLLEAGS